MTLDFLGFFERRTVPVWWRFRLLAALFAAILLVVPAIGQDEDEDDGFLEEVVVQTNSTVRVRPSASATATATLLPDEQVWIIDEKQYSGFVRILFGNSQQGFIRAESLKLSSNKMKNSSINITSMTTTADACTYTFANCPNSGCYKLPSYWTLFNEAKRTWPKPGRPVPINFAVLEALQARADMLLGKRSPRTPLAPGQRMALRQLKFANATIGEGSLVSVLGYIPNAAGKSYKTGLHEGSVESVNCNSTSANQQDVHIPLTPLPTTSEYAGIVIEMIPQGRNPNWNLERLRLVQKLNRLVKVEGGLFFDNIHIVNKDPAFDLNGHSRRMSLWEIHPVSRFYVCRRANNSCKSSVASDWIPLELFTTN